MHLDVKHKDSVGQAEFLGWAEGNECRSLKSLRGASGNRFKKETEQKLHCALLPL